MANIPTPHISCTKEAFAKTVLMPGDPLRSQFIAKNMLSGAHLINNVRGISGYTGLYKGKRVSIMASGMGMPSIGIYSYELFNFYNVDSIIRIGTAGAIKSSLKIRDIVLAMGASTNSSYAAQFKLPGTFSATASYNLLKKAEESLSKTHIKYHVGNVLSSDTFYSDDKESASVWAKMGVLCVEMETAALYMNAARAGKEALAILTISDSVITGEATTAEERQASFTDMVTIALETAIELEN